MGNELIAPMRLTAGLGGGDSNQGLWNAFDMFNKGLSQYATTRAINGATDQVNQLRMASMSDQEKKNQLNQVALNLTGQLSSLGQPVSQINNLVGQFQPKPERFYQTPFEAIVQGSPEVAAKAQSYQDARQAEAERLARIKKPPQEPGVPGQLNEKQQKVFNQMTTAAADKANQYTASSRSGIGTIGKVNQRIEQMRQGLLKDGDKSKLNAVELQELAADIDGVFTQGVATVSGRAHLVPPSAQQAIAGLQALSGNIEKIDQPSLVKAFDEIINRMGDISGSQLREGAKSIYRSRVGVAKMSPDDFSHATSEATIRNPDGEPEVGKIKNGVLRFHSDDKMEELHDAVKFVMANPGNPKAEAILQHTVNDPFYAQAIFADQNFRKMMGKAADLVNTNRFGNKPEEKK